MGVARSAAEHQHVIFIIFRKQDRKVVPASHSDRTLEAKIS